MRLLRFFSIAVMLLGSAMVQARAPSTPASRTLPPHAAPSEKSEYTYETVSAYAESWEYAIRWGDGRVTIADETGILKNNPRILELLNANLGRTKLVLTNQNKAMISIKWVDELPAPYASACATTQNTLRPDGVQIDFSIIRVRRENRCMGDSKNDGDILLLHEMGHALGFAKHAKEDDVMSVHDPAWNQNEVNLTTLQHFLTGLYSLSPGQKIPESSHMPEPIEGTNRYQAPVEAQGPLYAVTPSERLPESKPVANVPQFKRVDKKQRDGTWNVEFIPLGASASNSVENPNNLPILTPPGEKELPSTMLSSGHVLKPTPENRIIEINSRTKKRKNDQFETIGPNR